MPRCFSSSIDSLTDHADKASDALESKSYKHSALEIPTVYAKITGSILNGHPWCQAISILGTKSHHSVLGAAAQGLKYKCFLGLFHAACLMMPRRPSQDTINSLIWGTTTEQSCGMHSSLPRLPSHFPPHQIEEKSLRQAKANLIYQVYNPAVHASLILRQPKSFLGFSA